MPKTIGNETQHTIAEWAESTFGPVSDSMALVDRASLELAELRQAVQEKDLAEAGRETADVVILLYRLMEKLGLDLQNEVTAKMAVNRKRRWQSKGDGTGRHIE